MTFNNTKSFSFTKSQCLNIVVTYYRVVFCVAGSSATYGGTTSVKRLAGSCRSPTRPNSILVLWVHGVQGDAASDTATSQPRTERWIAHAFEQITSSSCQPCREWRESWDSQHPTDPLVGQHCGCQVYQQQHPSGRREGSWSTVWEEAVWSFSKHSDKQEPEAWHFGKD